MKNFILFILLFVLTSCQYHSRTMGIDISGPVDILKSKFNKKLDNVQVVGYDQRRRSEIVGSKKLGNETIYIVNNQGLGRIFAREVAIQLQQKNINFTGKNKRLDVIIKLLNYESIRRKLIGTSRIEIVIEVIVKQVKKTIFSKRYRSQSRRQHFITTSEEEDEIIINSELKNMLKQITEDRDLVHFLKK